MSDDGPPPSQPANNYAKIFFYQPDVPIPVFVEASSIRNRPKLIRSLRNSGALICHDPAEAHVILVDPTTDPGTQFIRDWGTDPAKFVLESSWARKCIEAGRPLLQNDNWGDSIACDDGRSISGANDGDIPTTKSPLPTPRPTPSDAEPSSTKRDHSQSFRPKPDPEGRFENTESSSSPSASQVQRSLQTHTNPQLQQTPQHMPQSQQFSYSASQSQPFPYHQQASQPQQFQPQGFAPQYAQSQQSQSNSFAGNAGMQLSSPFHMNSAVQMQQYPQTQPGQGMVYPPQMVQNYMGQPNGQQNGSFDAQMFLATFIDVARQQGIQMPLGVPQQMTNNLMSQMLQSRPFQNNGVPLSGQGQLTSSSFPDALTNGGAFDGSSHISPSSPPDSSSPEICAPSIRRRSPLPSTPSPPPPPHHSKGKEKVTVSRQKSSKRKRSESSDESSSEEELFATPPPRHRQTKEPQVLSPRKLGEIFRSDSGESLLFFVQVDLMGRHGIVQNIKKNGGRMGGSINDANYVVLGNTSSKTFPDLLAQTTAANKLPLRSAFIVDCVKHEALLDISDYVLEEYTPPKKRGRISAASVKAEKPRDKRESKKPTPKKNAGKPVPPIHYDGPPSPSPPPATTRVELPGGNFRFSDEEVSFFRRYARHLVEVDHQINNSAIFKRLHEKMPHHSSTSWATHIRRAFPDDLDTIRKKVGIARRKAADAGGNQLHQVQNEAGPSNVAKLSPPVVDDEMPGVEATISEDPHQQDFQGICGFFASGGGDNSDDEEVWGSLAAQQPCRSAASWPEFYQKHEDEIMTEIERLIEKAAADEDASR